MKACCSGPGLSGVPEPLERRDLAAVAAATIGVRQEKTGSPSTMHRAGAALAEAAAELGAVERQIVAQHVKQRRVRIGIDRMRVAVDIEVDHGPSFIAARISVTCSGTLPQGGLSVKCARR